MFLAGRWANAFINSIENAGGNPEEGIEDLTFLASEVKAMRGCVFGRSAAEKLEPLIRKGLSQDGPVSVSMEIALRFLLLMISKNTFRRFDSIMREIKSALNKKRGLIPISLESAFEPDDEFKSRLTEAVKKRTGAAMVELKLCLNPALIGGYRLRIGNEIIDASVRSQLGQLLTSLQHGGN